MRQLARNVAVAGDDGVARWYGPDYPDAEITSEVAERITNPRAWGEDPDPVGDPEADGPPPTSGPGSGKGAWAAYAQARGVEVPDGATREDIVAACEAAGVPTQ